MAEIDVSRADGVILFNGDPVADVRSYVPASILEAFYRLAECATEPDEDDVEDGIDELEGEIEELRGKIEAAKDALA